MEKAPAGSAPKLLVLNEKLLEERNYWLSKLSNAPSPAHLPFAYHRLTDSGASWQEAELHIVGDTYAKLMQLTAQGPFLLYTTLLATVKICLYKYTDNPVISVGSPARKQTGEPEQSSNALVIIDEITPQLSFRQVLLNVRRSLLDAYARQRYPFERLLRDLGVQTVENRCSLFDVAVALKDIHTELPACNHDVTLTFWLDSNQVAGHIHYKSSLFSPEAISSFARQFLHVLHTAISDTNQSVDDLSLIGEEEKQQVLFEWNQTAAPYPAQHCLHHLFERQVARTPDAIAVSFGDFQLTYQELDERANKLASYLQQLGVRPEVLVGIAAERSVETIIAILAVLKAGGAYVPLDPDYPAERLRYMIEDSQVQVLLAREASRESLPTTGCHIIRLDADWPEIAQQETSPASLAVPDNLANMIYTSGSTGMPKGVLVPHRQIVHSISTLFAQEPPAAFLLLLPFVSDAAGVGFYWTLCQGGRLVLPTDEQTQDPRLLRQLIMREQVSHVDCCPSLYTLILENDADLPKSWRYSILGGETCFPSLVERHYRLLPQTVLMNHYGPTETAIWCSQYECHAQDGLAVSVPIGRPIPNAKIYVLDKRLNPVPVGVPGELYVGGAGVTRGYLNRPELTAERFIPNPFALEPGERLYKTGDQVRYRPDGNIDFLGRLDTQVKLNGFRVELGEIEAVLSRHPAVQAAVVLARELSPGNIRLVGYVALHQEGTLTVSDLHHYSVAQLPDYMVPSTFVLVPEIPRTPNGKIDRQALPGPDQSRLDLTKSFTAPRTALEETLTQIFARVLGVESIGIFDNFFELGGHSLLATQILSRVQESCQVEISLRSFFKTLTVAGLAEIVEEARRTQQPQEMLPLVPVSRDQELPLSFAQQRLWFLDQLDPGNPSYNVPGAIRLQGSLQRAALEKSLQEIIQRHESLRTTFALGPSGPIQVIAPVARVTLPVIDLQGLRADAQETEALRLARSEAEQPFDLSHGPVLRATLLQLRATEHILLFTMHHIVSDGWSVGVLIHEMAELYQAFVAGRTSPLPDLPIQYADFALWQRRRLQGQVLEAQLAYWKEQLAGAPPFLELPVDYQRPALQSFRGSTITGALPLPLTEAVKDLSQRSEATPFMILLGAFLVLLHRYTGKIDIVVGTDVANRNRVEIEGLIGFFVNLLALRVDLNGNPTFSELLRRVRKVALDAYMHQDMPFEKLVDELKIPRSLSYTPLCQVLFVFQNAPLPTLELPDIKITQLELDTPTAKFDLLVLIQETEQGFVATWNYSTDLFAPKTIEQMIHHYATLLDNIIKQPEARLDQLDLLSEQERKQQAMEQAERKASKRKVFTSIKPKAISTSQEDLVRTRPLQPEQTLPLVVEPALEDVDLAEWAQGNRQVLEQELLKHGALLFRGFNIRSAIDFERVAQAVTSELFGEYGDLPREAVGGKVYTSTPYPADKAILFHNESSHLHRWPMQQWFFCVQAARQGGETPLVDCRKVYQALKPQTRERFAQKRLMYVRNFTDGLDVSWQEFFGTSDKAAVEAFCRQTGVECEWHGENNLRTRQVRLAVAPHPKTGEYVFFNQIQVHHIACLDEDARNSLLSLYAEEDLPRNVYYGDGTPIENEVIAEILDVYEKLAVRFSWQEGDIILLDNMLTAHGRSPFVGPRKIVVAMGEMIGLEELRSLE